MRYMTIKKTFFAMAASFLLWGCGTEPQEPANEVTDALYQSLRDSIVKEFEQNELDSAFSDSLFSHVYDSVYNAEFDRITSQYDSLTQAHVDSVIHAKDSLQSLESALLADSIYQALYDKIYADIYSDAASKNIFVLNLSTISEMAPAHYRFLATLYDEGSGANHLGTLQIANRGTQAYYKLVIDAVVEGYTSVQSQTVYVKPNDTLFVPLDPQILFASWDKLEAEAKAPLQIQVKVLHNDKEVLLYSTSKPIHVLPAGIMPRAYLRKDGDQTINNYSWVQWIQPQSDSVTSIVESARLLHAQKQLVGYQDPGKTGLYAEITRDQVKAVYDALQARGIGYVSAATSDPFGQVVLYPNQTLRRKMANCIDGAILFASVLERIGINVDLVIIPGHAFIGYRTWKDAETYEFVETTMAWNGGTFTQANQSGNKEYTTQITTGAFQNNESQMVNIEEARLLGFSAYPFDLGY